jgi:hypothetical protein
MAGNNESGVAYRITVDDDCTVFAAVSGLDEDRAKELADIVAFEIEKYLGQQSDLVQNVRAPSTDTVN